MKKLVFGFIALLMLAACGQSYEETKRLTRQQRLKLWREDSAALKIAVMPTLDCLPVFVAKERQMFDTAVDIRLKRFNAQMDVDTALIRNRVEGAITDLVRAEKMIKEGTPLRYEAATNAYWLMISQRQLRITNFKHLDDKMLAMTRYSVTDMLGDLAVDSAKLAAERVFRIQVNDVNIRLKMLENGEMDAVLLTEPQASQALIKKNYVMLDTRKQDMQMGALVFRTKDMGDSKKRQHQMDVFMKGYKQACDSINHFGVTHYKQVLKKYYGLNDQAINALPDSLKFTYQTPRQKDIDRAKNWLEKKK
jgi:NitT/TauT family transport system substrate-binding protein